MIIYQVNDPSASDKKQLRYFPILKEAESFAQDVVRRALISYIINVKKVFVRKDLGARRLLAACLNNDFHGIIENYEIVWTRRGRRAFSISDYKSPILLSGVVL